MRLIHDRGTLLLHDLAPGLLEDPTVAGSLGLLWDPRVRAFRAPGSAYGELRRYLDGLGVAWEDRAGPEQSLPSGRWRPFELRPYQQSALGFWREAGCRGIVALPTGAGKTRLALGAAAESRQRVLILVPTRALLEQWRAEIAALYDGPVGVLGDGARSLQAVTVSTYESSYRSIGTIAHQFELVVVDECHHFGRGARDEALSMCTAPRRLGLSATLPMAEDWLASLERLIGPPVFELGMSDLVGKYLAEFDYYTLQVSLTDEERFRYEREIAAYRKVFSAFRLACPGAGYPDWIRYASRTEEGRAALQGFQAARRILGSSKRKLEKLASILARHWRQKTLVFTSDTETAYRIAREHLIMPITAEITRAERERALRAYREGRLRALVSCRVLNEGVDVPDAEIAIVLGGTHGTREHIQRAGRVLRPGRTDGAGPPKRALLYELVCRNTIEVRQSIQRSHPVASAATTALQPIA